MHIKQEARKQRHWQAAEEAKRRVASWPQWKRNYALTEYSDKEKRMIKYVNGDLIKMAKEGEFDVIVHGCNCFCTMGAGIANLIRLNFQPAYLADLATNSGDRSKLGRTTSANCKLGPYAKRDSVVVVNAYTQVDYWNPGVRVDYDALRSCLRHVFYDYPGAKIGLPRIGAGLAGGDWAVIKKIIEEELSEADVTVVTWSKK